MKSGEPGLDTPPVEVTNISKHGFWLLLEERELFVPFAEFPWFRQSPVLRHLECRTPHADHLYWPDLDIDLAVESIEHPERFPLVSKIVGERRPGFMNGNLSSLSR